MKLNSNIKWGIGIIIALLGLFAVTYFVVGDGNYSNSFNNTNVTSSFNKVEGDLIVQNIDKILVNPLDAYVKGNFTEIRIPGGIIPFPGDTNELKNFVIDLVYNPDQTFRLYLDKIARLDNHFVGYCFNDSCIIADAYKIENNLDKEVCFFAKSTDGYNTYQVYEANRCLKASETKFP